MVLLVILRLSKGNQNLLKVEQW